MAVLTKQYTLTIDGKQAAATVGQLKTEIQKLEAELENVAVGSAEADAAIRRLGAAKGALKELDDAVDALDPKNKAAAFSDFANGVVGAMSVATVALQNFGLSQESADEAAAKLQGLLTVMGGLEQVSRALNSETLSVVKSTLAGAKAFLTAGEAATTGSKVTRAALITTGLGVFIVLLGLLVANWEKFTSSVKGSEKFFTRLKATASGVLDGILQGFRTVGEVVEKLWDRDFSGAKAKAQNLGKDLGAAYAKGYRESLFSSYQQQLQAEIEQQQRLIDIRKAAGRDTFREEEQVLKDKLTQLTKLNGQYNKEEKKAYEDALRDLVVLRKENAKKEREEEQANDLAKLNAKLGRLDAEGKATIATQLRTKQQELANLLSAADRNEAAITAKQGEIDSLNITAKEQAAEKARAQLLKDQQQEIELLEKQGEATLDLRIRYAAQLLELDKKDQGNEAKKQRYQDDLQAYKLLLEDRNQLDEDALQYRKELGQDLRGLELEDYNRFKEGVEKGEDLVKEKKKKPFDLGATLLMKLFGVAPEDVDKTKQQINDAYASIMESVGSITNTLLAAATEDADLALEAAQTKYDEVSSRLDEAQSRREASEAKLQTASGARRDYLISRIAAERKEEQQLASQKAKAAAEQMRAEKEKQKLAKISQQLSIASAGASALEAGTTAVASAAAIPFPANIPAMLAAFAAVGSLVISARALAKTFRNGGLADGPSHEMGGIQMWHKSGAHMGEMEGGEYIVNKQATAKYFPLLEQINRAGQVRVLPAPAGTYANGGQLAESATGRGAGANASLPPGMVQVREADLTALVAFTQQVAANTAALVDFGPARFVIGQPESLSIVDTAAEAKQLGKQSSL